MADGTPLPSWLTFNCPQMRFSGTAPSTAQTVSVKLTATDQSLVSASEIVTFNVVPAAPTLAAPTPAQMLVAGNAFTMAVPSGAFVDPQGQTLTYSATQSNGQALPSWLHFNTATDTFSGTAPITGQSLSLTVKATDISGLSAQETFNTTVIAAPVLNTQDQVATQTWYETGAVSLALPAGSFTDPQGQALTYTASQANGQALPAWLKFNAANQTFTGTAPGTAQTLAMKVTATDTSGVATSETFTANVAPEIVVNPAVASLGNLQVGGTTENITVPASLFTDTLGLPMTFLAYQTSGQNASSWLSFNQNTNTLSGVIPKNIASGAIGLEFVATDTHGISAADMFSITVFTANGYGPSLQPAVYSAIQLPTIQTASSLLAHH
jgi:hypothetical protein